MSAEHGSPVDLRPVRRAIFRVRLRIRLLRLADRTVLGAAIAAAVAMIGLYLLKMGFIPPELLWTVPAAAGATLGVGLLAGLLRRTSDVAAAKRLDDAAELKDRLGSAVAFSKVPEPTPFMLAAMADAVAHAGKAEPRRAVPLRWPRDLWLLALTLVGLYAAWLYDPPPPGGEGRAVAEVTPLPFPREPKERLLPHEKEQLEDAIERLQELISQTKGEQAAEWLEQLDQILKDLKDGKTTAAEAFRKMALLEEAAREMSDEQLADLDAIRDKLKEAAKQLGTKETTKGLKEALEKGDLGKAADELKRLAEEDKLARRERDRLAKQLQKMAEQMQHDTTKELEKLRREVDRLQKKKEKNEDRLNKREEDRLAQKKKQLEQLERQREQQQRSQNQKTLERLSRDLQAAADELRRQQKGQGGQGDQQNALSRAAEEMRRLSRQAAQQKAMKAGRARMVDIRELLRRAQAGKGKDDKGKGQGKGKGLRGKLEDFYTRAKGDKPGEKGKGKGEDDVLVMGEGSGRKDGEIIVMDKGQQAHGETGETRVTGDSAPGDSHDPNVLGKGTNIDGKRKESFVAGKKQEGESRSQTIYGAASEGFTSRSYKRVHHDYTGVVEEDMKKERIPQGYRRYVERYFDLIRPR